MSFLETSHVAEGPFGSSDPLADLVDYYQINGYEVVQKTIDVPPEIMTWKADEAVGAEADEAEADEAEADEAEAEAEADEPEAEADEPEAEAEADEPEAEADEPEAEADEPEAEPVNDKKPEDILVHVQMQRGKKGASIWSSNMGELLSQVDIKLIGNSIRIAYKIETTLQRFNSDDDAFWAHEAKQAVRVAKGGKAIDWRENESARVSNQQKDIIMIGVQLAFIAALLVAVAYFAFNRV